MSKKLLTIKSIFTREKKEWRWRKGFLSHKSGAEFIIIPSGVHIDLFPVSESIDFYEIEEIRRGLSVRQMAINLQQISRDGMEWAKQNPQPQGGLKKWLLVRDAGRKSRKHSGLQ